MTIKEYIVNNSHTYDGTGRTSIKLLLGYDDNDNTVTRDVENGDRIKYFLLYLPNPIHSESECVIGTIPCKLFAIDIKNVDDFISSHTPLNFDKILSGDAEIPSFKKV